MCQDQTSGRTSALHSFDPLSTSDTIPFGLREAASTSAVGPPLYTQTTEIFSRQRNC